MYLCTCPSPPGDSEYADLERTLQESAPGADLAALHYVRRLRRMKLTGRTGVCVVVLAHVRLQVHPGVLTAGCTVPKKVVTQIYG